MDFKKLSQRKSNLEKIRIRAINDKNIGLINIMKLSKSLNVYTNNCLINKALFNLLRDKYNVENDFINKKSKNKITNFLIDKFAEKKELWIYLTEDEKDSTDGYIRYENMILNQSKDKNIEFVPIGPRALEFCQKNKLKIVEIFDLKKVKSNFALYLSRLIKALYFENDYEKVNFIINSNKNYNNFFTILPIDDFDASKLNSRNEIKFKFEPNKLKFYPDVNNFVESQINVYLENAIQSLIIESSFFSSKSFLVKINKIIKDVEEEILKLSRQIIKIQREKEIEEIVLLTRNNIRFSLDKKEK
ncbi:MSC_0622 family F1-like ATPase gamma subunit [Mycoplasmopsis pulmonis]|nr:hypothetical protein [Mycoplasmopsis pulmonis]MDZ7293488.1 hypothetical protein [Mycoplasmopsis pulmonis]VEU68270.1 Uncharacterised protein [Mycoplasmopsis pulmonis]